MEINLFMDLGVMMFICCYDCIVLGYLLNRFIIMLRHYILFNWVIITGEFIQLEIRLIFDV